MITEIPHKLLKIVKLKDIASLIQYGYTAKAKGSESGLRFLRITDIQNETVEWSTVPSCDIPTKDKEKYLLSEGDIVFARTGATVGKSYLISGNVPEAIFASYLIRVRLQRYIDPKYINYFFRSSSYWQQITESSAGIGQPNVNGSKLADLQIPLASFEVQKQIVAEIEKQFSRLDEAVASLKRIQANLKRYKAAVLKAAVEGKLTEQWRKDHPDVEPADQLLKRILAERRTKWEAEELAKMKAKGIKPKDDSWKKKYK
jgi:type I restriction enzyme S subunit